MCGHGERSVKNLCQWESNESRAAPGKYLCQNLKPTVLVQERSNSGCWLEMQANFGLPWASPRFLMSVGLSFAHGSQRQVATAPRSPKPALQRPMPNHSVKGTSCAYAQAAPYLER